MKYRRVRNWTIHHNTLDITRDLCKAIPVLSRIEKRNKGPQKCHICSSLLNRKSLGVASWEPYDGSNIRIYLENERCEIKPSVWMHTSKSCLSAGKKRSSHGTQKRDRHFEDFSWLTTHFRFSFSFFFPPRNNYFLINAKFHWQRCIYHGLDNF